MLGVVEKYSLCFVIIKRYLDGFVRVTQAGLVDEFFFDNASESINHRYKVSIRNEKATCDPTGSRGLNCSMAEAGTIYHNMLEQTRRNIHRAVIGLGPYHLAPSFSHCRISPTASTQMSGREKATSTVSTMPQLAPDVTSLHSSSEYERNETIDLTDIDSDLNQSLPQSAVRQQFSTYGQAIHKSFLGDFKATNLPEMMKGSWSNANEIIASEGVGKAPGVANDCVVVSNTSARFHRVSLDSKSCPVKCDCACFEELRLCAHLLAVACYEKCLSDVIRKYQPNISSIVKPS